MPDRDRGQVDLTQFIDELADQPSFARACPIKSDGSWTVQRLDAVVGNQLPRERAAVWRYEDVVFVADRVNGDALRAWFNADGTGEFVSRDCSATVPQVFAQANSTGSHASHGTARPV